MAIVFAAALPHSPLLIPAIGKDNAARLTATADALRDVGLELGRTEPDTVVVVTSHAEVPSSIIAFNLRPTYRLDLEAFGEYGTRVAVTGDPLLGYRLKQRFDAERPTIPIAVTSRERLDYGVAIPLLTLYPNGVRPAVLPVGNSLGTTVQSFEIGGRLRTVLLQDQRRVAIIASANLSHRLSEDSPAGYSTQAKAFDARVLRAITQKNPMALVRFRRETLDDVRECGLGPLLLLHGLLGSMRYDPEILSYEHPFGIGYATALFHLST